MIDKKRLTQTLVDLCKIEATSGKEQKIVKYLKDKFKKEFNIEVEVDRHLNLLAKAPGVGEPVLLNAHLDTVSSTRDLEVVYDEEILKTNQKTILGGDDRTGIAMILEVLTHFKEEKIRHRPIEVLLTSQEEVGLLGSRNFDFKKIKAKTGFVLDEEGPVSDIITEAVGYIGFEGEIMGKMAHSSEPHNGVHAIVACADLIQTMPFGKCSSNTMVNVGVISGGEAANAITDKVYLKGEVRSKDEKELQAYSRKVRRCLDQINKKHNTKDSIVFKKEFVPFKMDKNDKFIKEVTAEMKKVGMKPKVIDSMGGSDANILNEKGVKVVSVASCYYKCHSVEEYVNLKELKQGVEFFANFLSD